MNIIVCTKAVPGFIKNPEVPDTQDRVNYEAGSIIVNESDDYAIEAGVKLAKKTKGKTTILTAGALTSKKVLQTGVAKDADSSIRVDTDFYDAERIAKTLAAAIKVQEFDLVVTGVESSDSMAAQVGVAIAENLGVPFAYAVLEMEPGETDNHVRITKELGFGMKQVEEITLPAVVCFQTGTEPPSFVPVRKMMMAQRKPSKTMTVEELGVADMTPSVKITEVFTPTDLSVAEMIEGSPVEQAAVALQKIKEVA